MTTWIKVLNTMPHNPKLLAAGSQASWLYVCGLCYSNEHLTDGFISTHVLPVVAPGLKNAEALASKLVTVGLWHDADGGWQIHDYEGHQRSADEIRERRRKEADRKAVARVSVRSPRGQDADSAKSPSGVQTLDVDVEVEVDKKKAGKPPAGIPETFPDELRPHLKSVTAALIALAEQHNAKAVSELAVANILLANSRKPLVRAAYEMASYWSDRSLKDVVAAYRNWLSRTGDLQGVERLAENGLPAAGGAPGRGGAQLAVVSSAEFARRVNGGAA